MPTSLLKASRAAIRNGLFHFAFYSFVLCSLYTFIVIIFSSSRDVFTSSSSSITFLIFVTFRKRKEEEKNWKSGIGPEFLLRLCLAIIIKRRMRLGKVSGRILLFNGKWSRRPEQHFEITHIALHQRFCRKVDSCRGRNSFLRNAHTKCDSSSKMWVTKPREVRNTTSNRVRTCTWCGVARFPQLLPRPFFNWGQFGARSGGAEGPCEESDKTVHQL